GCCRSEIRKFAIRNSQSEIPREPTIFSHRAQPPCRPQNDRDSLRLVVARVPRSVAQQSDSAFETDNRMAAQPRWECRLSNAPARGGDQDLERVSLKAAPGCTDEEGC